MITLTAVVTFFFVGIGVNAQNGWEFYAFGSLPRALSYGRLDPVVQPGVVSSHVHMFQGANGLQANFDYNTMRRESTCTTIRVQDDLSNYWSPAMYWWDGANNFTLIPARFQVYYQMATNSYEAGSSWGVPQRYPFRVGLKMLAGNMYQRNVNYSDPASLAAEWQCLRPSGVGPYSHDMRDFQKDGLGNCESLVGRVQFPTCWDGNPGDNSDLTHVVYPDWWNQCPESHPYALMKLYYEWYYEVNLFPFDENRDDNWVLSFGDTSGFGFHGDFTNGWNITLLTDAISQCNVSNGGIADCPPFAQWNAGQIPPCEPIQSSLYPNEDVGLAGNALTQLPGCNPVWSDNSTKATCPDLVTPAIDLRQGPDLSSWNYVGCPFGWTDTGFILTAYIHWNWSNMTADSCLAECKSMGYSLAMMMWGTDCFCDNQFQNNGSAVSSLKDWCATPCAGNTAELCGGSGAVMVYEACSGSACTANALPAVTTASLGATLSVPTTIATSTTSTSPSASPTSTLSCPASNNTVYTTGGKSYQIKCGTDYWGGDAVQLWLPSFDSCCNYCSSYTGCTDVAYHPGSPNGLCYIKNVTTPASSDSLVWAATHISKKVTKKTSTKSTSKSKTTTTAHPKRHYKADSLHQV